MILTIDIGNTNVVFAFYKDGNCALRFRHHTKVYATEDEYAVFLLNCMERGNIGREQIAGIMISSVVPILNRVFSKVCDKYFGIKALFVDDESIKTGVQFDNYDSKAIGSDRIANSAAAIARYKKNIIIVDFGTTITIDAIGSDHDFIGGIIAPGIKTAMTALHKNTALLPLLEIEKPGKVIGSSTKEGICSGVFYGTIAMVEGITARMKEELDGPFKVVATGGLAKLLRDDLESVDVYDDDLTTFGLYQIYKQNNN